MVYTNGVIVNFTNGHAGYDHFEWTHVDPGAGWGRVHHSYKGFPWIGGPKWGGSIGKS